MDELITSTTNSGLSLQEITFMISVVILLCVTYVLYIGYAATRRLDAKMDLISTKTNDAFAKHLAKIESANLFSNIRDGSLSKLLEIYAVYTIDEEKRITFANENYCQLSNHKMKSILGKNFSEGWNEQQDDDFWNQVWEHLTSCHVWHGELSCKSNDGHSRWMDTFILPLSLISSEGEGYIFLGSDITDIKNNNLELSEAVKEKDKKLVEVEDLLFHSEKMASLGTISAGIAHEINLPVSYVSSNLERLCEYSEVMISAVKKLLTDHDVQEMNLTHRGKPIDMNELKYYMDDHKLLAEETFDGFTRIKTIINDLKTFSHSGSHGDPTPVDINECITTAINIASSELKYRINVVKNLQETLPKALIMESQLSQVILNMIVNAAHAIDGLGMIVVTTSTHAGNVRISVKDNGCGMPKDVRDKIFEPFFTTKDIGNGTGLGLSISHDIISRHGGSIEVNSHVGDGTEFIIDLPICIEAEKPEDNVIDKAVIQEVPVRIQSIQSNSSVCATLA